MAQGNYGKFGILKTTVCVPVQCYVSVRKPYIYLK